MTVYATICTRSREDVTPTTDKLLSFLAQCDIKICLISGSQSIFEAYEGAYLHINPNPEDILIFCHDDIEIHHSPEEFLNILKENLDSDEVGFIGPAGTTYLSPNAIWWDHQLWQQGKHRGRVFHYDKHGQVHNTVYGPPDDVVVLDGLFLATKPKVIEDINLQKPEYFVGDWDYYDINLTSQAFLKGYTNKAIALNILHNSRGEIAGKAGWELNRAAFIANTELPMQIFK